MTAAPEWEPGPDREPILRLTRDLREAAATLSATEARFLVDAYYQTQGHRIQAQSQLRELVKAEEPHETLGWMFDQNQAIETGIKSALGVYALSRREGRWALSIVGIGPVIAAGMLAHIDVTRTHTASGLWRFAGLDPSASWEKGQKRPWNARLKVLAWKAGESFVKVQNRDGDVYGQLYAQRKAAEQIINEEGGFAQQAAAKLERFKIGKTTDAYKAYSQGRLPPAHLHARARRYAVKMFFAHYFDVAYEVEHGTPPPRPWIIEHGGHAHLMPVPNWPID